MPKTGVDDPYAQYDRPPDVRLRNPLNLDELKAEGTTIEISEETPPVDLDKEVMPKMDPQEYAEAMNESCKEYDGSSPFESLAVHMTKLTLDGGVLKRLVAPGYGPKPDERAIVRVHYNGFTEYSDEPFDSSRLRGQVFRFNLASGEQLPGLAVAVHSMQKGEKAQFLLKPAYAYGRLGCPPRVPPDATILFNLELLSFTDPSIVDEYYSMRPEERKRWVLVDFLKVIAERRKIAKENFDENQRSGFRRALQIYVKLSEMMEGYQLKDEEEEKVLNKELVTIYLNISLCAVKLGDGKRAVTFSRKALEIEPCNTKGLCRRAQGYALLGDTTKAIKFFKKAQTFEPNNTWITQQLAKIDQDLSRWKAVESDLCRKMFAGLAGPKTDKAVDKVPESVKREFVELLSEVMSDSTEKELVIPADALSEQEINGYKAAGRELNLDVFVHGVAPKLSLRIVRKES